MEEELKNETKQLCCNLLALIIVKDYIAYLGSGTKSVELESLVQYHIKKAVSNPTEEYTKKVMNKVLEGLRIRSGVARNNSKN